ncbi:hypothetical protein FJZ55_09530 [Candidatus Woesearchaeota archaeon]|nr:hypothetical protein [Candidatus Woesearchaeota archaeon]
MKPPRIFQLSRTMNVLAPPALEQGVAHSVVAGEACTEIGCEALHTAEMSWLQRWFGIGRKANRLHERKGHGFHP